MDKTLHILHLEDDADAAALVERAIAGAELNASVHRVESGPEYLKALNGGKFDLILSDSSLPGMDGPTALRVAGERLPAIPFLFICGHLDEHRAISLKAAGAADCLHKSELSRLAPAIRRALRRKPRVGNRSPGKRYLRAVERLVSVVQELSLARDLETIMAIARHAARELTGADGATFVLRDNGQCYYADEESIAPLWKGRRFPMETCISGWAMLNKQPAVIEDIYTDERIPHDAYRPTFVKSLVTVPIRTRDPIGAIGNYWADRHHPTDQEVELLQALANTTAVAMENVEMYLDLENRVKERTLELELANKELESFSYAVSHDLRAPLRHVQGFSNALLEDCAGDLNEAGQAHLERICRAVRRMDQLIEDLLSLSRAAQAPVRKTNVDLSRMARDIVSELRSETPDRNVELVIAEDLAARGDQRLLHVVLTNLLSNAWKFTGKRDNARIEVSRGAPADGETTFCVRDNGAGFDMKYAEKLFSVFQRLHSDRDFPGTGVGLATVQRIIHKHGGRIWAESTPGEGAAFYFTLPPS